jgi:hypothetical protein
MITPRCLAFSINSNVGSPFKNGAASKECWKASNKYNCLNLSNINAANVAHCLLKFEDELYHDYGIPPIYTPWDNFVENLDNTSFGQKIKTKFQFVQSFIDIDSDKFSSDKNSIKKIFKFVSNKLKINKEQNYFNWIFKIFKSFKQYCFSDLFINHSSTILEEFSELFEIIIKA